MALALVVALLVVAVTGGGSFAAAHPGQPGTSVPPGPVEPAPERAFSQPADDEIWLELPPVTKQPPVHSNLDPNLNLVVEEATRSRNPASIEGTTSAPTANPVLVTFYVEPEHVTDVRQYLEDNDVYVRNVGEDYVEAHVPPHLLPAASKQSGVLRVDTVIPPNPAQGRVISQGAELHRASAWHSAGYRGQGVKIGIIDSGFEDFSRLQQGGELPLDVFARCYFEGPQPPTTRLSDCEVDGVHGTAVSEAVIDVAPDAQLYIAQPISDGDLRNAVDWMAEQGVQVINHSLGAVVDGPGDGTSPFSDSPLRTVDAAVAAGITWVNAAGNSARMVWYGPFSDPNNNGIHNFAPTDEGNTFEVSEGGRVIAFMRWDDDWGHADCDLDLGLFRINRETGNWEDIAVDTMPQDGSEGSYPFAGVMVREVSATIHGRVFLGIRKASCADEPRWIQLIAWIDDDLQHYSPGHHMGNPEESRNPGFLAVGATHYWDTNTIAIYSSRGPTIDGRTKPEITGVACGRSAAYAPFSTSRGLCWFPGTSQASPHVAGLTALVKHRYSGFSPAELARFMMRSAQERGLAGPDNTWGTALRHFPILPLGRLLRRSE